MNSYGQFVSLAAFSSSSRIVLHAKITVFISRAFPACGLNLNFNPAVRSREGKIRSRHAWQVFREKCSHFIPREHLRPFRMSRDRNPLPGRLLALPTGSSN